MAGAGATGIEVLLLAAIVAWLTVLTVVVTRRGRRPGEPVYRRLPDGRLRFEWSVSRAYETGAAISAPTDPIPASSPGQADRVVPPTSSWASD